VSLLNRKSRPLGRQNRVERDDRKIIIATEDTYAPKQYFEAFELSRVDVHILETLDGKSAAKHVVERLKIFKESHARDLIKEDLFWVVLDTDHYAKNEHVLEFANAIKEAKEAGFKVAISKPCFEFWLLLHKQDASTFSSCADVDAELKKTLSGYSKTNIPADALIPFAQDAVRRAEAMKSAAENGWPQTTGTQVHLLVKELLKYVTT
jgi:RloB-like protein